LQPRIVATVISVTHRRHDMRRTTVEDSAPTSQQARACIAAAWERMAMTELTRRAVLAGLSAIVTTPVHADAAWPSRAITLTHGWPPGGPTDFVARILAEGLSRRLGQPIVVDPRPGAAGTTAAAQVARAAPDGHTLIAIPGGHATAAALYSKLPYRTIDDFSMIGMIAEYPFVVATYPDHPIGSVADLLVEARSRTTPLLYGTPGIGTTHHLLVELLASMANVRLQHVPYRGSAQVVTDLVGKRLDFMVDPPTLVAKLAKDGQLRALAVTGATRFFGLPDVPTVSEAAVPGYVATSWQGLAGPAGMPASIVARLNSEIAALLAEPSTIERLRTQGNDPRPSSSDGFKARVTADIDKWAGVVAAANIERI
jgi:tripartite-type tricarboxylate transporter receptor subunit TctC